MILVTGGTGFVGQVLVRQLTGMGKSVRILIRPAKHSPRIPRGVPVEVAVANLHDPRSLRAALKDVDVIYHLAGVEARGTRADLLSIDIQGTQVLAGEAAQAGIQRIFYLSHLGADRASAYPVLKAKAIAEHHIRQSGVDYTILRSGIIYGLGDHYTTGLARLLHLLPGFFIIPGAGSTQIQPVWVEDIAACLAWAVENPATRNQIYAVGGPEHLSFRRTVELIQESLGTHRRLVSLGQPYMRGLTIFIEQAFPGFPVSIFWLDYLAVDRICALDTMPRVFGLMPARFSDHLGHLEHQTWNRNLIGALLRRRV